MGIDYDAARRIALAYLQETLPADVHELTLRDDKPSGWIFCGPGGIGFGPFIVDREDGRVFQFGSGGGLDEEVAEYEKGFRSYRYDLTIFAVHELERVLDALLGIDARHETVVQGDGEPYVSISSATRDDLSQDVASLPHTFTNIAFGSRQQAALGDSCEHELREHRPEGGGAVVVSLRPGRA